MSEITETPDEFLLLRKAIDRLAILQMNTIRQLARLQAEVQANGVVSAMAAEGAKFDTGEAQQLVVDALTKLRRAHVQQANDFLLVGGFISELPPDDERWDEPS